LKQFIVRENLKFTDFKNKRVVLTIGTFDAIHIGHQKIINTVIKEAEKERKSAMGQHIIIMYLIYFTFIGIILALTKTLTSFSIGSFSFGGFQTTKSICEMASGTSGRTICSFLYGICNLFGLGSGNECYYRSIFLSMTLVQGMFAGLVAGQIGEESVFAGIKHSLIMVGIGFVAYLLAIKIWL